MRYFIIPVPLSKAKLDLARVQIAPTCPSVPLCAFPVWHPTALWEWRASAMAPGETPFMR